MASDPTQNSTSDSSQDPISNSTPEYAQIVDAREIEGEPFSDIMTALDGTEPGETILLINSFEPTPLYDVLAERGFVHETTQVSDDEWHVEITHE